MTQPMERMLGFDARRMALRPHEAWGMERRRQYLLNEQAERILSTDGLVWPSLFATVIPAELEGHCPQPVASDPIAPDWIGPNPPFWSELPALREHVVRAHPSEEIWIVAATCLVPSGIEVYHLYFEPTIPKDRDPSWDFLGYDVSDSAGLSGLTNCGYRDADFSAHSRDYWAAMLNQYHLFQGLPGALAFRQFSDVRIAEHAPFLVYGLYRIEILRAEQ